MNFKLSYTRLLVDNFKDCFLFYRDIMGFKAVYGAEDDVYADFDTGPVTLALFNRQYMSLAIGTSNLPSEAEAQDCECLCFSVDDVDSTSEELKKKDVRLVTEPADHADWGIRAAHFRDPAGNLIEIFQSLAQQ
jgi:lactoylglutathione lyase